MNIGRYIIGFAAGSGITYFAMAFTAHIERIAPQRAPQVSANTAAGALSESKTEGEAGVPASQPLPEPPAESELKARMAHLGMSDQQAHEALAKLGPVKLNAFLRREEENRKNGIATDQALNESRRSKFRDYVETVHNSQKEVLKSNPDDEGCEKQNCAVPH